MSGGLPDIGADIVLEFQQSINNVHLFGQAMEGLDTKFGSMERRIDAMRSSLSSLSSQVSRGSGNNLRTQLTQELNSLVANNGIVLGSIGSAPFKVKAETLRNVFNKVESELNTKLAHAYQNISLQVSPNLQVGKIPLSATDFDAVNKSIARLVKVQLNNLVGAMRKSGAGMISAQDLSSIQFHIGKDTIQQIINRVKAHIKTIMLNPAIGTGAAFTITDADMNKVVTSIKSRLKESIDDAVKRINGGQPTNVVPSNLQALYTSINTMAKDYVTSVTRGINTMNPTAMTTPLSQISKQLQNSMAKSLGVDLKTFQQTFANHKFSGADISTASLRSQFGKLEQALNKKISGGLAEEVKAMVAQINGVQINYSPKLQRHIIQEIGRINNSIVKKIREQIDVQFQHMQAELNSLQVSPKDINRSRSLRNMGRVDNLGQQQGSGLLNDPYARRDNHFNGAGGGGFGIEGAITNTFRHLLAGSLVGAPMMLLYKSVEQFKTSQLEQLKMFSNFFSKADADSVARAATGDNRDAETVANETVSDIMPYVKEASNAYAIDYGKTSQIASIGSRLLDSPGEVKEFTKVVGKIYSIDREGDPVSNIAPGLEAFMGQFDLSVGELESRVLRPMAVATNLTNATTESVMNALMRSGSTFRAAGVSPEKAIAMTATSIKYTGLSGENIGNFYKSVLPRLQSESSLKELDKIGVTVYENKDGVQKARSADAILDDVSKNYQKLNDSAARGVIMDIFGTYQSSKGMTTLDEFDEFKKLTEALETFSTEDMDKLLNINLNKPIIQMQRAGSNVEMSLTSVIEELTPEIVAVSKSISNLADGIQSHKEALAGFIKFLGTALIGLGIAYGIKRLGMAAGVPGAIARQRTSDSILGNRGIFGGGRSQGTLLSAIGNINSVQQSAVADTKGNRSIITKSLANEVLAPHIKTLATMTDTHKSNMNGYIRDNNLRVKSMKDIVLIAEESRDYKPKKPMTPDERRNGSQFMAGKLYGKGATGINENFTKQLTSDLQNQQRYDQINKTKQGKVVTKFLGGLDESGMKKFQGHLEEMQRTTGKTINSIGGLSHAVNTYTGAQAVNREELRRTNPHLAQLSTNLDRVMGSVSGTNAQNGMRNMNTFLGGLGTKARGAVSAMGGLAKSVSGFGVQMLAFAGIGEFVASTMDAAQFRTQNQKELKVVDKEIKDVRSYQTMIQKGMGGRITGQASANVKGALDWIMPGDRYTGQGEMMDVEKKFKGFLTEKHGAKFWGDDARQQYQITDFLKGKDVDALFNEFLEQGGNKSLKDTSKAKQTQEYKDQMTKMELVGQDKTSVDEGMKQKKEERVQKDLLEGSYTVYDLNTVKTNLDAEIKKIDDKAALDQLKKINEGYVSDSAEFVAIRQKQSDEVVGLYQSELVRIAKSISDLEIKIADMKLHNAKPDEIKSAEDDLLRWKNNLTDAQGEFGISADQRKQETAQVVFDTSLSRVNRSFSTSDSDLNMKEAVNATTMDRSSKAFSDASNSVSLERINALSTKIEQLKGVPTTPDQQQQVDAEIEQLKISVQQERGKIRDNKLSSIGLYKDNLQDSLSAMSNDYMQAKVDSGITDDNNPYLRNIRTDQYNEQVSTFGGVIADLQKQLTSTTDPEAQKTIQREIRDLQRQSLTAQLGILDEMKNTGGTFNLPENVKAMTYYEYLTKNNTHSTYTVQGGDTNVTVTLPNISDGSSTERIKQIGKALGEGMNEGKNLRLQKQANPFGYRG